MRQTRDILALRYGPTLAKALASLFLGPAKVLVDVGAKPLEDVLKKKADALEAKRLLGSIQQEILEPLAAVMDREGGDIGIEVVAAEAAFTLEAGFSFESLVENLETPGKLPRLWASKRQTPLNRNDSALASYHDIVLMSTAQSIFLVLPQMPGFMNWFVGYVSRQGQELGELSRAMQDLLGQEGVRDAEFERRYRQALIREHNRVELFIERQDLHEESQEQTLTVAYVTLTLARGRLGTQAGSEISANYLLDALEREARRVLVVGKAGCGKTTLLRWVAIEAAQNTINAAQNLTVGNKDFLPTSERARNSDWREKVPFLIRLRHWERNFPPTPNEFHKDGAPGPDAPAGWAERILRAGRGLLLLDGLDELSPARRKEALTWIQALTEDYPSGNVFLASSRPAAVEEGALESIGFSEFEVRDLSPAGRIEFVRRWHEAVARQLGNDADRLGKLDEKRDYLLRELDANPSVAHLAVNPLLCALLCALNRVYRQSIPKNLYDLCDSACRMLLWDRDRLIELPEAVYPSGYFRLNRVLRLDIVRRLAHAIVQADGALLPRTSALRQIRDALGSRSNNNDEALDVLRGLLERSGLLRPSGIDDIEFVHNTLRDFLAAAEFAAGNEFELLVRKLDAEGPQRWEPILLFAAATEEHKSFAQDLLRTLLDFHSLSLERRRCRELTSLKVEGRMQYRPEPELQGQVDSLRAQVLPVDTFEKAEALAEAGEAALDFLLWRRDLPEQEAAACVRGLGRIDGERARESLCQALWEDKRPTVLDELAGIFKPKEVDAAINVLCIPSVQRKIQGQWHLAADFAPYIRDLSPLAELKDLRSLRLTNTLVSDLSPLAQLAGLQEIDLTNTLVSNLSPLAQLAGLQEIDLTNTLVSDLSPLTELKDLRSLRLTNTQVSDLSPLAQLDDLRSLWLISTSISDLSPLAPLAQLQEIDLTNTPVSDLSPLAQLAGLQWLRLVNTQVNDLSPLAQLAELQEVGLTNTLVSDLSPLDRLPRLRWIGLVSVPVEPTEIERFHEVRRSLNLLTVEIVS